MTEVPSPALPPVTEVLQWLCSTMKLRKSMTSHFFFQWLLFSAIALSDFGAPLKAPCYRQRIAQFSKFDLGKYRK